MSNILATRPAIKAASGTGPRGRRSPSDKFAPYLFVSPFLILFAVFGVWPILHSLILAFYHTNGPKSQVFAGFDNFKFLFADPDFHTAVWNTLVFAFWSVVLQIPFALGLAILLNQRWLRGRTFLRLAFFSPNLLGQVFVGVLFSVLLAPQYGLVNKGLHALIGLPLDTKWLANPALVMPALILTSLWLYVGFNMIYFLAALQAVDKELYEAAMIDGAGPWRQFLAVTLPSIRPVAVFVLVTTTIGSFQLFELPYIMLNNSAGPDNAGLTVVMYLYNNGFVTGNLGYASAVGWTLAIGVLLISLAQMRMTGAWKAEAK
ncbi:L-arabinose transport system permease protein AraP [Capsulimonas corticalis]|uniref:L-arabinose transport system permease protein AraP n=1 Tax=Capsulimonas corticalis TaxID=2219043 RepID=A0A402CS44_9BACT|nr:sugar ABC transporter permease [Capsulimonas corticalis]BDI28241.1 L-arabinose transport system permease protein AraP [Capsulimonas corticalis]